MKKKAAGQSILVVEDYDDIREVMKAWLKESGYLVFEAADGREAVEVAEREHPNLILMDFNLPVLDGFVAAQYIRQVDDMRDVPIVGLTLQGKGYSQSLAIASGCNEYLEKPINFDHLDLIINRLLTKGDDAQA